MFGNLGNLASLLRNAPEIMRQAQQMQARMQEMQETLARVRVEGSAGGGMVTVRADGQQKILGFSVEEGLLTDREMLEDLLVAATNQALEKSREAQRQEMGRLTGGMDLPGMGDLMSKMGLGGFGPLAGGPAGDADRPEENADRSKDTPQA